MKIKLVYQYNSCIGNSYICIAYDGNGKEMARGYHHQLFTEAKWSALREAQRLALRKPITIPEPEYHDVNWGLNG